MTGFFDYLNQQLNSLLIFFNPYILLSGLIYLLAALITLFCVYHLIRLLLVIRQTNQTYTQLEVKPLRVTEQNSLTTEKLFAVIHGLAKQQPTYLRFFNVAKTYSLEIVSTKQDGIKYLVRVDEDDADLIKKTLMAYLPGISVTKTNDYLPLSNNVKVAHTTEFKLAKHFAFPLKQQSALEKHDPIAYLTGSMTQLEDNELTAFQLVMSPVTKNRIKDIGHISNLIYAGKDLSTNLKRSQVSWVAWLPRLLLQILLFPIGLMVFIFTGGKEGPILAVNSYSKDKTSNPYQEELELLIKGKLGQPLFTTSMRLMVAGNTYKEVKKHQKGFVSAISSFANADYQAVKTVSQLKSKFITNLKHLLFMKRFLGPIKTSILSTSEISDLYHFPFTKITKTEDIQKQYSKELPAPLSLKGSKQLDVIFAKNEYGGIPTPIGLTKDERRRHVYILGATGTGKTTMLLSMIKQDLENNKGVCLIDPHGDLTDQVLSIIPESRLEDVVYFNPDDISYPMGINLLELTPGLKPDDAIREKEFIAESIISVFHKIYTDKYSGPRMEYILRNTIHTAFTVPGATLFTVYKLLINTPFRKSVTRNLTDENLKDFWKYEFSKAGDYQKVKMVSPITNKIGRFLFSPTAKRILEQSKSTVSFDSIINDGKILLCNLSKGKIGEDNSSVFGVLIMAKIQLAALKRARIPENKRKDFYLYVDEFQNFATPAFAQILSEARKYRLNAILAHQTTSQIEDSSLVNVTLANTGTVICFRTANPEDERVILPQFRPYVEQGEIASLPSYRFYMRLGALNPEEPFSGMTTPIAIRESSSRRLKSIENSRKIFASKYKSLTIDKKVDKYETPKTRPQQLPKIIETLP